MTEKDQTLLAEKDVGRHVVTAAAEVVSCELASGSALLDMRSGLYFGLNPVAALIWSHVAQPVPVSVILDDILAKYDVSREQATADLLRTLDTLKDAGLIHVTTEPSR